MPRDSTCCLTNNFYCYIALIIATSAVIPNPYSCCKKKDLQYVVKLLTSYCAYYICAKAQCFLVFSNTKRGKFNYKEGAKQLLLLKAKANATRFCLKLKELKEKRFSCKREEIAAIKKLEQLKDAIKILKKLLLLELITRIANFNFLDLELLTNLGQL